ncbi:uncharacterized protein LOC141629856 [Silene latifolia]|uniref:uncharacterized protein LOC141629856 n=1 Tax=Silene latifolia TaxID=37657 RepID=UPI003D76F3A3
MARVLKGKYFADRDFLGAELGSNPSYTWRSIWEAKDVILLGARRRIGDGWSTKVWLDPWIPNTQSRRVLSPRHHNNASMKVADLMTNDRTSWDDELLRGMFLPFEQDRIKAIRICDAQAVDDWCWDHTKDGQYSVKTAYHLLTGGEDAAEQSDWARSKWMWKVEVRAERVREWVEGVLREGSEEERMVFSLTCWAIWECRNAAIFEGRGRFCEVVTRRVYDMLREINDTLGGRKGVGEAASSTRNARSVELDVGLGGREGGSAGGGRWRRPGEGVVKINTDAGVIEGVGTGLGVVARTHGDSFAWAVTMQERLTFDVKRAEAEAIFLGMKEVRSRGHTRIIVESDCWSVIKDLQDKKKGRADIFRIYDDILSLCNSFISLVFSFVRRESNCVAHLVAHSSPWIVGRRFWSDEAPQHIVEAISNDINNMI